MSAFITETVTIKNRENLKSIITGAKHQELTIEVKLISSGDVSNFSKDIILKQVHDKLKTINHEN